MANAPYSGIRLDYDELISDARRMSFVSADFLEGKDIGPLKQLETALENARYSPPKSLITIGIPQNYPIKTKLSSSYRGDGQSKPVRGELSFNWEISNCEGGKKKRETVSKPHFGMKTGDFGMKTADLIVGRSHNHVKENQADSDR